MGFSWGTVPQNVGQLIDNVLCSRMVLVHILLFM